MIFQLFQSILKIYKPVLVQEKRNKKKLVNISIRYSVTYIYFTKNLYAWIDKKIDRLNIKNRLNIDK